MRIQRFEIRNYRGIASLDSDVPAGGVVFVGTNAQGKSSALKGILAALRAEGVEETDIRLGEERAELLVSLDGISVRRTITAKGSKVKVTNAEGFEAPKPAHLLNELFPSAAIDPLSFYLAKPAERVKQILDATPITVDVAKLRQWAPTTPDGFDCSGHGLKVLERLRKLAYDQRTAANAKAKAARDEAERGRVDAEAAGRDIEPGSLTVADARSAQDRAKAQLAALDAQREQAARSREKTASAREKAQDLRARATAMDTTRPDPDKIAAVGRELTATNEKIAGLERELATLRGKQLALSSESSALLEADAAAKRAAERAAELASQADTIEATIAEASTPEPSPKDIATAQLEVDRAVLALGDAEAAQRAATLRQRADELAAAALTVETEAMRLDGVVKALTNDAPAALLAEQNGIRGLTIDGDRILLDGRALDALSGAEQLRFAVEISKRAAGKARLLIVDGLERVAPDQMDDFIRTATDGGYQLLCTRVDRGALIVEAIEPEAAAQAAAE